VKHRVSRFIIALALIPQSGLTLLHAAARDPGKVELRLKIVPPAWQKGYRRWAVELQDSKGNPLVYSIAGSGDTVRFRGLQPDIYTVCLTDIRQSRRCRSVDLFPSPGSGNASFTMEMATPDPRDVPADTHTVSLAALKVPPRAQRDWQRALEARQRGDAAGALRHLERALAVCPDYPQALNDLGAHYLRKGDYGRAGRLFARAVELEPAFYAAWVNLSRCRLMSGDYARAAEAGVRALALRPGEAPANSQLALSYYLQGDLERARRYFLRVAELDPASPSMPHLYLARIAFTERRREEGARHLRDFIEVHPNAAQVPHYRALLGSLARAASAGGQENGPPSP